MKIDKTCPKCGYNDAVMTFLPKGKKYFNNDDDFELLNEFLGDEARGEYTTSFAKIVTECVKVHCRTCQYQWVSPTLDSKEVIRFDIEFPCEDSPLYKYRNPWGHDWGGYRYE